MLELGQVLAQELAPGLGQALELGPEQVLGQGLEQGLEQVREPELALVQELGQVRVPHSQPPPTHSTVPPPSPT